MLSFGPLGKGQDTYYSNLAAPDPNSRYYTEGGEPSGFWPQTAGNLSLGLSGTVSKHDLDSLFRGCKPDGTALVQNANDPLRRPGWDACFSAPKSVSLVWGIADDGTRGLVERCHLEAVTLAIQYIEQEAAFCRRGKAGARTEPANIVVAAFEHSTSRSAWDPQLHTHALILNIAV